MTAYRKNSVRQNPGNKGAGSVKYQWCSGTGSAGGTGGTATARKAHEVSNRGERRD